MEFLVLLLWVLATSITQAQVAGDLRLVSATSTSSSGGRLEIFLWGEWGTVCDDLFDSTDALVACRQLGYSTVVRQGTVGSLGYPQASLSVAIWLDNLSCSNGLVPALLLCDHNGIGEHNCIHSEDQALECSGTFTTPMPATGAIRLVNDTSPAAVAGRVEIYWSGQWGTVCTDNFGLTEANVVCRQLGFSSGAIHEGSVDSLGYPSASSSVPTWLDNVDCSSLDTRLQSCNHNGFGVEDCTHVQDQAVVCRGSATSGFGDLRLVSLTSFNSSSGRLEIFLRGEWGTVCDDGFEMAEADVACRQLGYAASSQVGSVGQLGYSEGGTFTEIWLDNVDCSSSDTTLLSCNHNGIGVENCGHSEDVAIECSTVASSTTTAATSGDLRLAGSSSSSSGGRLEIYLQGEWGTVCDDGFGLTEAEVACRQLGFNSASGFGTVGQLGFAAASSNAEIWLDDVRCSSSDTTLLSCRHRGIGVNNCVHSEDVALECSFATRATRPTTSSRVGGIIAGVVVAMVIIASIPTCVACIYIGFRKSRPRVRHAPRIAQSRPAAIAMTTTTERTSWTATPYPVQPQQVPSPHPSAYPVQSQQAPPPHPFAPVQPHQATPPNPSALPDSTLQQGPPPSYAQAIASSASYSAQRSSSPYPPQGPPYSPLGPLYQQQGTPYPQQQNITTYPSEVQSSGYTPYPDPDAAGGDSPSAPPRS